MNVYRHLVTTVLLVGSLFFSSFGWAQSEVSEHLKYFPEQTRLIVEVNVEGHRDSVLVKEAFALLGAQPKSRHLVEQAKGEFGFELERDLKRVTMGFFDPPGGKGPREDVFTLVLQGDFERERVVEYLENKRKAPKRKIGDLNVFTIGPGAEVAMLESGEMILVSGPKGACQRAWAVVTGGSKTVTDEPTMRKLIGEANQTSLLWLVFNGDQTVKHKGKAISKGTLKAVLTVEVDNGAKLAAEVSANDAENMSSFRGAIEQLSAEMSQSGDAFGVRPIVDNLQLKQVKESLSLTTSLTEEELRTIFKKLRE